MPRVLGGERGQLADDAPAGRAAAGVRRRGARVAALEAEREAAVGVGVEADAELEQVADLVGRLVDEHPRRATGARRRGRRRSVSRRCCSGESSSASAAARPPWAQ